MEPKLIVAAIVTLGSGQWMVAAGLTKRALQLRSNVRRCPSCGRFRRDCRCVS
jgi:Flp pilus assembly secretin CpaC